MVLGIVALGTSVGRRPPRAADTPRRRRRGVPGHRVLLVALQHTAAAGQNACLPKNSATVSALCLHPLITLVLLGCIVLWISRLAARVATRRRHRHRRCPRADRRPIIRSVEFADHMPVWVPRAAVRAHRASHCSVSGCSPGSGARTETIDSGQRTLAARTHRGRLSTIRSGGVDEVPLLPGADARQHPRNLGRPARGRREGFLRARHLA